MHLYEEEEFHYSSSFSFVQRNNFTEDNDTSLPEGIESVHPRYAISWRNNWMLKQSDYVATYITHSWGGAAQYAQKAMHAKKRMIKLREH